MNDPIASINETDCAARVQVSDLLSQVVIVPTIGASVALDRFTDENLNDNGFGIIHLRIQKDEACRLSLYREDAGDTSTFSSKFSQ